MKVLIVEDDQFLQKMYYKKFDVEGFSVEIASNGEEGLEKLKSFMPDIVLMDIMMPKLNGIDALGRIKEDDAVKQIPVIILTNLSNTTDAELALSKGAAAYIVKSDVTPQQVVDKAKEVLSAQKNS